MVDSIRVTGSALPWIAHAGVDMAQTHILDAVEGFCQMDPDWLNKPVAYPPKVKQTPRQQQHRIDTLGGQFRLMTDELQSELDGQTALDLFNAVSRHNQAAFETTRSQLYDESKMSEYP